MVKILSKPLRKPDWLKTKLPSALEYAQIKLYLSKSGLHTICESGNCPNLGECWAAGNATFMILGDICTRNCRFCSVTKGIPLQPDSSEPENIAEAISQMKLKHCVLTSVDRDDLRDLGAGHWAACIKAIKAKNPDLTIETLIPDFQGREDFLKIIVDQKPEIISHNLETVERLTAEVRIRASYAQSLRVIKFLSSCGIHTKSGIMLGLGETKEDVIKTMNDLLRVGCGIFTLGQYLQPTRFQIPVTEYVHPDDFAWYKEQALGLGFHKVESSPLVRSSYHAERHITVP
ncbi:MAG: lipoyl synthase [Bacteroidota bacterium]